MRDWGGGNDVGAVYFMENLLDLNRVGNCWIDGRLKLGDVVLCTQHTGDCFYDYVLLQTFTNGLRAIITTPGWGAYALNKKMQWKPTARQFHLLLAGESVLVPVGETHPLTRERDRLMTKLMSKV